MVRLSRSIMLPWLAVRCAMRLPLMATVASIGSRALPQKTPRYFHHRGSRAAGDFAGLVIAEVGAHGGRRQDHRAANRHKSTIHGCHRITLAHALAALQCLARK